MTTVRMPKMKICLPESFVDFSFQLLINQNMTPNNIKSSQYFLCCHFVLLNQYPHPNFLANEVSSPNISYVVILYF
jgi:hypothetical protein